MGSITIWLVMMAVHMLQAEAAVCTSNLLIDNFARFPSQTNTLGFKASDDGSMQSISLTGNVISFVPKTMSYFYETIPCIDALGSGYSDISFGIKAPKNGSIALEVQSLDACSAPAYKSTLRYVRGFTGDFQTIAIPLSTFAGVNTNAVGAFNWGTWDPNGQDDFVWQLGDVELICSTFSRASVEVDSHYDSHHNSHHNCTHGRETSRSYTYGDGI
ncbi:hypothetical protein GGR54DRAFT_644172 [Hypoxylon sp. NC1633]|nr:hypothetical protein GGR54DRAFT_644172 [Hypoxylon sp. NC1633]